MGTSPGAGLRLKTVNIIYILGVLLGTVFPKIAGAVFASQATAQKAFLIYLFAFLAFTGALPFLGNRHPSTGPGRIGFWIMRFLFPTVAVVGMYLTVKLYLWVG